MQDIERKYRYWSALVCSFRSMYGDSMNTPLWYRFRAESGLFSFLLSRDADLIAFATGACRPAGGSYRVEEWYLIARDDMARVFCVKGGVQ